MAELLPLSPVPLYTQLKELLRERILDGTYPSHSRMPSESELGKAFDVSRITVRQALGAIGSLAVGGGLMALVFFSNRSGHDQAVHEENRHAFGEPPEDN